MKLPEKPEFSNMPQHHLHPIFEPLLRSFNIPYASLYACTNCGDPLDENDVHWDSRQPFCSLECVGEYELALGEDMFDED